MSNENSDPNHQLRKRKVLSIKVFFTSLITVLLSISGIFIIILSYQGSNSAILQVTERLIKEINSDISTQTENYFNVSIKTLQNFENNIHTLNLLDNSDQTVLDYLSNTVKIADEISAIYFGEDTTGNFYMAKRMPNNSISKRTVKRTRNLVTITWTHDTPDEYNTTFPPIETFSLAEGYDPRVRSWYKSALTNQGFSWTLPYVFASDNNIGLSVSKKIYKTPANATRDFIGVMAVDFNLSQITTFLESIDVLSFDKTNQDAALNQTPKNSNSKTKDYQIFLMTENRNVIATSDSSIPTIKFTVTPDGKEDYEIFSVTNIPDSLIKTAYSNFIKTDKTIIQPAYNIDHIYDLTSTTYAGDNNASKPTDSVAVVSFNYRGDDYFTQIENFLPSYGIVFKTGIIFKSKIVTGPVDQVLNVIAIVSIIFIMIIIAISSKILNNITNPIIQLAQDMDKVRTFDIDVDKDTHRKQNFLREINNINSSYTSMKNGLLSFKKFVPSEVVAQIVKVGQEAHVSGDKLDITIFFSDIEEFTSISDETPSEQLISQLRYYLNVLSEGIADKGGTLDKYIGDSIMAFWGAPVADKNHALNACTAALHCRTLSEVVSKKFTKFGLRPMRTRFGIHTGPAIVGNIGSDARLNYTAIGDNVNLASRLEGLNKFYNTNIIISEQTYQQTRQVLLARLIDKVVVVGKKTNVFIYELIDFIENTPMEKREFYNLFNEGTQYYFERNWNKAIKIFKACLLMKENDGPSNVLLSRSLLYLKKQPSKNWDGTFVSVSK
ncbi:adenylate cyclase [Spirochaetota bacterium]|nr:adenylate cyclase [Spirochaetota bacterium]